jgi:3(or 17)beta-hydroxysteroid dehydrogenase
VQRLNGRVAIVTGGASGLGKAIAARLVSEGARVVITDVQSSLGQGTAAELGCDFVLHDVTEEAQWNGLIKDVQQRHGALHVLVNNAGITGPMDAVSPEDTRLADWKRIFAVNVEGVFLGCRAAIPAMHAVVGGAIINMSSIAGLLATPYGTAYGASKATVRQLTKSVAQHCVERRLKIRCNSVHPGIVRTPLWETQAQENASRRGISFERFVEESRSAIPMGDFIPPQEVAAAVAYLASDECRHMTGAELILDGGTTYCDTYYLGLIGRYQAQAKERQ